MSHHNPWLVPLSTNHESQTGRRLVAFPHAGAGAFCFRDWGALLPDDWSLWAVQLPGRETRSKEPFATDLAACGQAVAEALCQLPEADTVFYGHSMGALVAFESCRALRRWGRALPTRLVVGARRAPHIPEPDPCHLENDSGLIEVVMRLGSAQSRLLEDARLRAFFLPIIRADFRLFECYRHLWEAPLDTPISVFGGSRDQEAATWELLAWQQHTAAGFSFETVDDGHFFHQTRAARLCSRLVQSVDSSELEEVPV